MATDEVVGIQTQIHALFRKQTSVHILSLHIPVS